jgi:hypothetical protein
VLCTRAPGLHPLPPPTTPHPAPFSGSLLELRIAATFLQMDRLVQATEEYMRSSVLPRADATMIVLHAAVETQGSDVR